MFMPLDLSQAKKQQREFVTEQDFLNYGQSTMEDADQYCLVANIINANTEIFRRALLAMTVNAAFACELYMKSIIASLSKKKENGHHLNELFSLIESEEIKKRVQTNMHCDENAFYLSLRNVDEAFMSVRYASETKGMTVEVEFIIRFMNALKQECKKLYEGKPNV